MEIKQRLQIQLRKRVRTRGGTYSWIHDRPVILRSEIQEDHYRCDETEHIFIDNDGKINIVLIK